MHPWRRLLSRLSRVTATQLDALAFLEREQAAVLAPQRVLDLESLERRILLNAVPVGVIDQPPVIQTLDVAVTDTTASATPQSAAANPPPAAAAEAETTSRHELVVIESGIENFDSLLDELRRSEQPGTSREILVLDSDDGVDTVTAELHRGTTYDAVHLLVHGSERAIRFGGEWLLFDGAGDNVSLADWRAGLSPDADLLFYSCDTAATSTGRDWLARVAQETGADVAASTDNTGAASLGGNWTLEYQLGAIDTPSLATTANVEPWHGLLATFTVTTTSDSLLFSLRAAITAANLLPGTDTIDFSIGSGAQTLTLSGALPTITDSVIIDGTTQPGYSGTPLITIDGSGITGDGLTLDNSGSTIQGLVISGFTGNGIVLAGSGGHTIQGNWIGLDASGTSALANTADGIAINAGSDGNLIGGALSSQRNVIAGSGDDGISVRSSNNSILGNWIGLTPAGTSLGNTGDGIAIEGSAGANTIGGTTTGQSNRISFNGGRGVSVAGSSNVGIVIRGNDLSGNTGLGIDLGANGITVNDLGDVDTGANQLLNRPILFDATPFTSSTTIRGTFTGAANTAVTIDFYAATTPGSATTPQANTYLGSTSVTTDAYGVATFSTSVATAVGYNQALTATATVSGSGTSELAAPVPAAPPWNKLYWIDRSSNTLERIDLDTTDRQTLVSGLSSAHAAAIDPRAGYVYYVDQSPNRIRRVTLDGTTATTIYTAASGTISSLAVDSLNGQIYYTNVDNGVVGRIDLDGSNDTTIVSLASPTALALSEGLGAIFYSDQTTIYRRDLTSGSTATLASGIGQVHALAVEEASGRLYFTDFANGSIQRVGIDGTGLTTLVSGENNPAALAIDPRRNVLYWSVDQSNRIRSASLDGTGVANWENGVPFADDLFFATVLGNDSNPTTTGLANVTVSQGAGPSTISLQSAFADLESGAAGLSYRLVGNTNGILFQNVFLDQASSTLRLTYDSGQSGTSTLTVRATDGDGRSVDASFVVLVNTAPTISTVAAQQMGPGATLGPLAFTVGDGQSAASALVVTATSSSQSRIHDASIVLGGSGANRTVTLTSAGNAQVGTATITLTVSDGGLTAQSQFVVTIQTGTPTAAADSYTMAEDGILSIPAGGVLTNDTDPQGNTLTAILVGGPSHAASFTLNANGSFNYTPTANYFGTDTFTYRASNGTNQSSVRTATITITAVNDAPTITGIADLSKPHATPFLAGTITIADVDNPPTDLVITATSSDQSLVRSQDIAVSGTGSSRTVAIRPQANVTGTATITLLVSDGTASNQTTFQVTLTNAPPTAVADAYSVAEDSTPSTPAGWWNEAWQARTRLTFNNAASSETLTDFPVLVKLDTSRLDYRLVQSAANDLRFLDDAGASLAYDIASWNPGGTSFVWVKLPTIAANNSSGIWMYYGNPDATAGARPGDVWSNGFSAVYHMDLGGTALDDVTANNHTATAMNGSSVASGAVGLGRTLDGVNDYIALPGQTDYIGSSSRVTLSTWVNPASLPTVESHLVAISEYNAPGNQAISDSRANLYIDSQGRVIAGGRSTDTESLRSTSSAANVVVANQWQLLTAVIDFAGDRISIYRNGSLVHSATVHFSSTTTPATPSNLATIGINEDLAYYRLTGAVDETSIARVGRSSSWIRADYLSQTDAFVTYGAAQVRTSLLANDTDANGTQLRASLVSGPAHASAFTLLANGIVRYTPVRDYFGADSFTYLVSDGLANSAPVTVTINVTPVNDLPTVSPIADQSIDEDSRTSWLTFSLQDVDSPIENLSVTASSSDAAILPPSAIELGGSLANRTIRITPPANASGDPVTVTLFVNDGVGTAQATFRVTVRPVNDAPTLSAQALVATDEDVPVSIPVNIGDIETDPDRLIVSATSSNPTVIPDSGLVFSGTGTARTLTVHPATNQHGAPITVTVTVSDGDTTAVQTIAVRVNPLNDAVQSLGFPDVSVDEDSRSIPVVDLTQGFTDAETPSSRLQYAVFSNSDPALITSTRVAADGTLSYRLAPDASGTATLTIQATDPEGTTALGTLLVIVNPVNDAPRFGPLTFSPESLFTSTISGNILARTTEVDGQPVTLRLLAGPARGTLTFDTATGQFSYTPGAIYAPTDSFTVEASDGTFATIGTVTLNTPIRVSAAASGNTSTGSSASTSTSATTGSTTTGSNSGTSSSTASTTSPAATTTTSSSTTANTAVATGAITISPASPSTAPVGMPIIVATTSQATTAGLAVGDLAKASFGTGPGQILAGPLPTNAVMSSTATASDGDDDDVSAWVNTHNASTSGLSPQGNSPRAAVSVEIRGSMLREWTVSSTRFTEEYLLPDIDSLGLSYQSVQPLAQSSELHSELAKVENDLAESFKSDTLVVGSAVAVTSGLSVGYVIWLIRSGLIMTSLLAQVPAWQDIDPLTVLDSSGGQDEDGESLQSLVDTDDDDSAFT